MVTVIKLELDENARKLLGRHIRGTSKPATRDEISMWVHKLIGSTLEIVLEEESEAQADRR